MQNKSILYQKSSFSFGRNSDGPHDFRIPSMVPNSLPDRSLIKSCRLKAKFPVIIRSEGLETLDFVKNSRTFQYAKIKSVANENLEELSDEDDDICPAECVREFRTDEEFFRILEKAKETNSLVVVDFYRTACGSCKYIEQIFSKLCRGAGDQEDAVIFLKHNVIDEYDDQSEVAERLRIKCHCSNSIKMGPYWKHSQLETNRGLLRLF
ncbi:thioredoxin-like 4, chloroplastic isoform X2 [Cornus florida]|uniref:thioredoxin-like 4, chloroplastic isoform X2 n=1 Tax=Cornus florida TaxID=4283 RepID=UPI00289F329E|nr:thioredoxin-like 4, chloroplastic isoform X2 [Cornus florida]